MQLTNWQMFRRKLLFPIILVIVCSSCDAEYSAIDYDTLKIDFVNRSLIRAITGDSNRLFISDSKNVHNISGDIMKFPLEVSDGDYIRSIAVSNNTYIMISKKYITYYDGQVSKYANIYDIVNATPYDEGIIALEIRKDRSLYLVHYDYNLVKLKDISNLSEKDRIYNRYPLDCLMAREGDDVIIGNKFTNVLFACNTADFNIEAFELNQDILIKTVSNNYDQIESNVTGGSKFENMYDVLLGLNIAEGKVELINVIDDYLYICSINNSFDYGTLKTTTVRYQNSGSRKRVLAAHTYQMHDGKNTLIIAWNGRNYLKSIVRTKK